jgi:hypothetical protein
MDRLVVLTASVVIEPVADIDETTLSLIHSIRRNVITQSVLVLLDSIQE